MKASLIAVLCLLLTVILLPAGTYASDGNAVAAIEAAMSNNEYKAALALADAYIAEGSNPPDSLLQRVQVHLRMGDHDAASADLDAFAAMGVMDDDQMYAAFQYNYDLLRYEAALEIADIYTDTHPNNGDGYVQQGIFYQTQGDYAAALDCYNAALAVDPTNEFALSFRTDIYGYLGDTSAQLAAYDALLTCYPNDADALTSRGDLHFSLGNYDAAIADYTAAIALDPTDSYTYMMRSSVYDKTGNMKAAVEDGLALLYSAGMLEPPAATAEDAYNEAFSAYLAGAYEEAIAAASDMLLAYPEQAANILSLRGACYLEMAEYSLALVDSLDALALNPLDAVSYSTAIHASCITGKYDEALTLMETAIALDIQADEMYMQRGHVYELLGNYDAAASNILMAIDHAPDTNVYPRTLLELYNAYDDYEAIVAHISDSGLLAEDAADAAVYLALRGNAYGKLGQYEAALSDLDAVIALSPVQPLYYSMRAAIYENMGNSEAAATDRESFAALDGMKNR